MSQELVAELQSWQSLGAQTFEMFPYDETDNGESIYDATARGRSG